MLGIFCSALFIGAISVYVFHDVDHDKIGHWNEAFANLSIEVIAFSLMISGAVWLLALLGRRLFNLRDFSPRAKIGLYVGIATAVLVPLRIRRQEACSKPRRVSSLFLFSRRRLPLYRYSPARYLPTTEPPKALEPQLTCYQLLNSRVLGFGSLQHRDVCVGVFPEFEEVVVGSAGLF
jgi:hypothetical protein